MNGMEACRVAAAERDRRAESYPAKIREGADAKALTIDYQCWVAIAEWLESDRFFSFAGGAQPDSPDAPIIRWPELAAAAERALTSSAARCDRLFAAGDVPAYEAACDRRATLWAIHRKVRLMRDTVAAINAGFRDLRKQPTKEELAA